MKKFFHCVVVVGWLLALVGGVTFDFQKALAQADGPQTPIGSRINIAVEAGVDEKDPAVVQCGSSYLYLVVYEREGDIYGKYLDQYVSPDANAFLIFDGANNAFDPAIACYWRQTAQAFLVVFAYDYNGNGSDIDVRGQLVKTDTSGGSHLIGGDFYVSQDSSSVDETDPAAACNSAADTCLVTFTYSGTGNGDVYGQRLDLSSGLAARQGDRFAIGDHATEIEGYADVVLDYYYNRYLVAWQSTIASEDGYNRILYVRVYATEQGPGENERSDSIYLLDTPTPPDGDYYAHQVYPSAAYNFYSRHYMITYLVNASGWTAAYSVIFTYEKTFAVKRTLDAFAGGRPAAAWSGGSEFTGDKGKDEFLAVYASTYAAGYQGIYSINQPDVSNLNGYAWFLSYIDWDLPSVGWYYNPDAAGSSINGRYLVVYEKETYASGEHNIYGQRVDHIQNNHLPLIRH